MYIFKRFCVHVIALLLFFHTFNVQAQSSYKPDWSLNLELHLPVAFSNKPFENIMQGLINVEPSLQYTLPNSLSFAIGGKYSFFTVNEFRVSENITGGVHSYGGWAKVGREKFHTDRFGTDIGLKVGYLDNLFATTFYEVDPTDVNNKLVVSRNQQNVGSVFFEPTLKLMLTADARNVFSLSLGYNFSAYNFLPTRLGIETNAGYDAGNLEKNTSYLLVGFGYTLYFKVKPEEI